MLMSVVDLVYALARHATARKTFLYILAIAIGTFTIIANNFFIQTAVRSWGRCQVNVLISGDPSHLSCRLARRLLREGHRVTLMHHIDHELPLPTDDSRAIINKMLDELAATEERLTIRRTSTCYFKSKTPEALPFSHVVFLATALQGRESPSTVFVRHSLQCLTNLLEETKLNTPRPMFTLVKADDTAGGNTNVRFDSIMNTAMEIVLRLHWTLYSIPGISLSLLPDVDRQISMSSSSVPPVVEEVVSSVVDAMQKHRWCTNNYWEMTQPLHLSENASSQFPASIPAAKGEDVVLTTYFTSKKDPQRKVFVDTSNYSYVANWHLSLRDLGMKGVIFHDGLSPAFISRMEPEVTFQRISVGKLSLNDDRYFHFLRYIEDNPNIEYILFADVADVVFVRNPFDLMRILGDNLYIGDEMDEYPLMRTLPWTTHKIKLCFGKSFNNKGKILSLRHVSIFYNAGIIGGPRHIILPFLRHLTAMLRDISGYNCNTPVVNFIAHKYFDHVTFTGFPMTSRYKEYRNKQLSDAYVIHK